ncbi:hypothetical protein DY000_02034493 [Brassica cretica]|uniref:Uncharacterized protein n=1 Tax=Brassica cretica TaxID=69181 RepID=A0ABQ7DHU0_BRACR|nr:hypothetical protein DY000_02034493 [Brassica cretica]
MNGTRAGMDRVASIGGRAGAALGSRTYELGSGMPWAEVHRGRELEQMREQETRSGFRVRRIAD